MTVGRISDMKHNAPARHPSSGRRVFATVPIQYPQMTIRAADQRRLFKGPLVFIYGWRADRLSTLSTELKAVVDNVHGALGRYPEGVDFFAGIRRPEDPKVISSVNSGPSGSTFTVYVGWHHHSRYVVPRIATSVCENFVEFFLAATTREFSDFQVLSAFVNGINDNPYLTGLKLKPGRDLSASLDRRRLDLRNYLLMMATWAEALVKARVVHLLHPRPDQTYDEDDYRTYAESMVDSVTGGLRRGIKHPGSYEKAIVDLAAEAALAEVRAHPEVATMIETEMGERLPLLGVMAPPGLFAEVKQSYLQFAEGIEFRNHA